MTHWNNSKGRKDSKTGYRDSRLIGKISGLAPVFCFSSAATMATMTFNAGSNFPSPNHPEQAMSYWSNLVMLTPHLPLFFFYFSPSICLLAFSWSWISNSGSCSICWEDAFISEGSVTVVLSVSAYIASHKRFSLLSSTRTDHLIFN